MDGAGFGQGFSGFGEFDQIYAKAGTDAPFGGDGHDYIEGYSDFDVIHGVDNDDLDCGAYACGRPAAKTTS